MVFYVGIFILILVCLFAYMWLKKESTEVTVVRSNVDGRDYVVQNKPDKQDAADRLAQIRAKMMDLMECLKKNRNGDINKGPKAEEDQKKFGSYNERIDRLISRFDPNRISEGNEDTKFTTYTLNKGDKIVFCLRARGQDDRVHDLQLLTFVAIHELAHIASITEHHTEEFKSNFSWLLDNAVACGIYKPEDFKAHPRNYCGIPVTDTPLNF